MLKAIPKEYHDASKGTLKLLWEEEWRGIGITQVSDASRRIDKDDTDLWWTESRLGALRGARARTTYSAIQVGTPRSNQIYA